MPGHGAGGGWGADPLDPVPGSKTLICGGTGTGKSELARAMSLSMAAKGYQLFVIDTKNEIEPELFPGFPVFIVEDVEDINSLEINRLNSGIIETSPRVYIIRPTGSILADPKELDRLWTYIYNRGKTAVWIDEAYDITAGSSHTACPPGLLSCIVKGRVRQLTFIICTQRPCNIPTVFCTESGRFATFDLAEDDRDRIGGYTRRICGTPLYELCEAQGIEFTGHEYLWWCKGPGIIPQICRLRIA